MVVGSFMNYFMHSRVGSLGWGEGTPKIDPAGGGGTSRDRAGGGGGIPKI
jgi:hypothetical protein